MFVKNGIDTVTFNYRLAKRERHFSTEVMKVREWTRVRIKHEIKQPRNLLNVFTKKLALSISLDGKEFIDEESGENVAAKVYAVTILKNLKCAINTKNIGNLSVHIFDRKILRNSHYK